MARTAGHIDPTDFSADIAAYRRGDAAAGDAICRRLRPVVHRDTARMLGDQDGDVEDVVQESLLACLGYLADEAGFDGDPTRLAVTIARNRCRDLLRHRSRRPHVAIDPMSEWLSDPSRSALDDLDEADRRRWLQKALDSLSHACRRLLRTLYVEGRSAEEARLRIGLGTVQGVYYRRGICLRQARNFLHRRLGWSSGNETSPGAPPVHGKEDAAR